MINFNFGNIINNFLFGFLGILMVFILKKTLFKKFSQKFNYYVWLPLMLVMVMPLKITITKKAPAIVYDKINEIKILSSKNISGTIYEKSLGDYIAVIYVMVITSIIIFQLVKYFWGKKIVMREAAIIKNEEINKVYYKVEKELNIKKSFELRVSKIIDTPMNMGIFKPQIIIPNAKFSLEELELIFKHELIHHKRCDFLYKLLMTIVQAVNWINPLVYFMINDVNNYCETSCDEEVIKNLGKDEIKIYSSTILKTDAKALGRFNSNLSFGLNKKTKSFKRINIMFDERKKFKGNIAIFIVSVFIFLSFGLSILEVKYVNVQASGKENNNIESVEANIMKSVQNNFQDLDELNSVDALTEFFKGIMVSGDKKMLENFLEQNHIVYNENEDVIEFNYKQWHIEFYYDDNSLIVEEK